MTCWPEVNRNLNSEDNEMWATSLELSFRSDPYRSISSPPVLLQRIAAQTHKIFVVGLSAKLLHAIRPRHGTLE